MKGLKHRNGLLLERLLSLHQSLATGIRLSKTKLTALVDDDAVWVDTFLENLILPFQYPNIAGVGVKQVAHMKSKWNLVDVLADMRLSVR
jgi:cellulose synthase/poly-beta-1,6-N-acetylglucosamine synthase-like glycosyltransferase